VLRPLTAAPRWTCYFLYLPDGLLTDAHLYTLERLRAGTGRLLALCASPSPEQVPAALADLADALIWKGLSGYDFSAYALALRAVAEQSPGADLFIMNDSVLGPFADVEAQLAAAPWALTGFTAAATFENHIQSYAFNLRGVTDETVRALAAIMPEGRACDRYRDVVNLQETRFARVAARCMSVGALWYAEAGDPSLAAAQQLLDDGFPFLKRSLLGRYAHFQDEAALRTFLAARGHPLP
jgi:lipopolysaccharide biosynthesis protein